MHYMTQALVGTRACIHHTSKGYWLVSCKDVTSEWFPNCFFQGYMKILASQLGPPWFRYNPWEIRPYFYGTRMLNNPLLLAWFLMGNTCTMGAPVDWSLGSWTGNNWDVSKGTPWGFYGGVFLVMRMGPPLRIRLVKGGKPIYTPFRSRPSLRWGDENDQNEPTKTTYVQVVGAHPPSRIRKDDGYSPEN